MTVHEVSPEKNLYAIIEASGDFIQCVGVKSDFDSAVSEAFQYASEQIRNEKDQKGAIEPMYQLNTETGYAFEFTSGKDDLRTTIYILRRDRDKDLEPDSEDPGQS